MNVTLTWPELTLAAQVGCMRQIDNLQNHRPNRYGAEPEDGFDHHVRGAAGEMGVAKALNLYWSGQIGNLKAPDVAHLQVRTTPYAKGDLRLHPGDDDDKVFVLVTGIAPKLTLCGWLKAKDGKLERYWKDPTGKNRYAFFVPQAMLNPINTLFTPTEIKAVLPAIPENWRLNTNTEKS